MKIKRTFGATMREALAQVKAEQGADAVILGNKKVPGGVEILSTIDFDQQQLEKQSEPASRSPGGVRQAQPTQQKAYHHALAAATDDNVPDFILEQNSEGRREPVLGLQRQHAATAPHAPVRRPQAASAQPAAVRQARTKSGSTVSTAAARKPVKRGAKPKATQQAVAPKTRPQPEPQSQADQLLSSLREREYKHQQIKVDPQPVIQEVKDELKNLRDLMKSQLNVLEWDRYSERHPVRSVLLNLMTEMGLGTDISELIFANVSQINEDPHKVWQQALGILASSLPVASTDVLSTGGRIALVGSTGVGKTTTIAKLAARFAHNHGKQSVALVTTDNFRLGAHEQLQHFARMLEIPLLNANNSEELSDRLRMLSDKRLVLIDTAGMSQNDVRLSEQFHKLQHGSPEIRPYLVLSANTQLAALNETVNNFAKVKLSGAIVTKLDESGSLGGIITTSIRHQLQLAYCGTGQRVPEDLHQARSHRLVGKAVWLMQKHAAEFAKESLAFRYNDLISQHRG